MIAHVAQADEQRGRVVLWLGTGGEPQATAIDAAVRLAQAFDSEVESLFIEDQSLFDLAQISFAKEIPLSGRGTRTLEADALTRDLKVHAGAMQRLVLRRAQAFDIKAQSRTVRDEPVRALADACLQNGPWNVVTMGSPVRGDNGTGIAGAGLATLFDAVHATTGFVVAGAQATRTDGPVIAVVEELERVVPMMRAAERIARATGGDAQVWLLEHDQSRQDWVEGQIRLALDAYPQFKLEVIDMSAHTPQSVAGLMRAAGAGFVLTRFGGMLVRRERDAAPFASLLDGPLFLVR